MLSRFLTPILIFIFWSSFAGAQEIEQVIVTGIGSTKSEAIIDAQRQALTQVVGKYVVSRDVLKNRKELSENVYSYSNGFVSSFDIQSENNTNGLFEVIANVGVSRTKLFATIDGLNINRLSIGDQASALATGVASQSKDFKEMVVSELYDSLESREIFDVVINEILIDAEPPESAVPKTAIYLSDTFGVKDEEIRIGDYFYEELCKKTPNCESFGEGMLVPLIIDTDLNLKSDFVDNLRQLFLRTAESQNATSVFCKIGCYVGDRSSFKRLTDSPDKFEGVLLVAQNGSAIEYNFTKKNERILDSLASKYDNKEFWITLSFLDFNDKIIDELRYEVTYYGDYGVLVLRDDEESYGQTGLLALRAFFPNMQTMYRSAEFMLGVNTKNHAVYRAETFNLKIPVAVTEDFIQKFKEILISVSWE